MSELNIDEGGVATVDEYTMDDVELPEGKVQPTDSTVTTEESDKGRLLINITLPTNRYHKSNFDAIKAAMEQHSEAKGVPTLLHRLARYNWHLDQLDAAWEQLEASARFLSGTRAPEGEPRVAKPETIAYRFYNTLNTAALKQQCSLFGLSFESYETIDAVIDALVEQQVAMMSVG